MKSTSMCIPLHDCMCFSRSVTKCMHVCMPTYMQKIHISLSSNYYT